MLALVVFTGLVVIGAAKDSRIVTVGIISQPSSDPLKISYYDAKEQWSYVAGSYADWVGSSGAAAVLIPFDLEKSQLDHMLENVDGIVFPGGGEPLRREDAITKPSKYQTVMSYITDWAIRRNNEGKYFPIFATCLGFEGFLIAFSNNTLALECDIYDESVVHRLFTTPNFESSEFWNHVGIERAKSVFATKSIYYTHSCGIRTTSFNKNAKLTENFNLLATSSSKKGINFVASMEHKKYPFIGNQWHPEKNLFERSLSYGFVDRGRPVLDLSQRLIATMTQNIRTKGNPRQFKDLDPEVKRYFVSNQVPVIMGMTTYERIYTFDEYSMPANH